MKTKDRLKEEIGFDKLIMTIVSAIFTSLVGWLFQQNLGLSIILISAYLFITCLFVMIIVIFLNINTKIAKLDLYE